MIQRRDLIPVDVIYAAIQGNEEAIATVITYYQPYISALAAREIKDNDGNAYVYVDESIRLRLETKLIYCIIMKFKILLD